MSKREGLPMSNHQKVLETLIAKTLRVGVRKAPASGVSGMTVVAATLAACLGVGCGSDDSVVVQPEAMAGAAATVASTAGASAVTAAAAGTSAPAIAAGAGGSKAAGGTSAAAAGATSKAGSGAAGAAGTADAAGHTGGAAGKGNAGASAGNAGAAGSDEPEKCDKIPPSSKDCDAPLAPGDDRKCTIDTNRSYYMYAPPTYNPCKASALVVDCHGATETAEQHAGLDPNFMGESYPGKGSGWRLEADTAGGGFIVATPQGINNLWNTSNNDPKFFLDLIDHIKKVANIDAKKVYMTGISNGSMITYQTVCPNTEVFAGISPHSAGVNCDSIKKPIPVISFDAEPDFAYQGTVDASANMVKLNKCTGAENKTWLTIDSKTTDTVCRNDPYDTNPKLVPCNTIKSTSLGTGIKPTVCRRTDGCEGGVAVVFCEVAPSTRNGAASAATDAHIIYGNATSLNTPSVAWRFFKSFW
jgi:poly(3-hydroxybutyrate) depolymerase